ncbi:MAG: hypothetical protein WCG06_03090 [Candidatus Omnitrophota bacterium]
MRSMRILGVMLVLVLTVAVGMAYAENCGSKGPVADVVQGTGEVTAKTVEGSANAAGTAVAATADAAGTVVAGVTGQTAKTEAAK